MFFDRIIRNLLICFLLFILAVNIYTWAFELQVHGNVDNYQYKGFYTFFQHLSSFPNFEFFVESFNNFTGWISQISTLEKVLAIITLGVSFICEILFYFGQMIVCLLTDVIMIVRWLLEFLGIQNVVTIG